jgi:nucleoid DNA-binding protein
MSSTLSRVKLAHLLAAEHGLTLTKAEAVMESMVEAVAEHLSTGERVSIHGLGSFHLHHRKEPRAYVDITTGERKVTPPRVYVRFVAGKKLRDTVRGTPDN